MKLATSQGLDGAKLLARGFAGGGCPLSTFVRKIASGSRRRRTVEDRGSASASFSEVEALLVMNYRGDTTQCL